MTSRAYNVLEGMGEAMLGLSRKHSTPQQWAAWLKVPLQAAALEGDLDMVAALLKAGATCSGDRERDGQTPLHAAAKGGSLDVVMALLEAGALRDKNKTTRGTRQTPLFCAVKHGHADVALALVRAGSDVDLADAHGWSPLMRATKDNRPELVNNLLLSGASAVSKNKRGSRPLHLAVEEGHLGIVQLLLKAGASPGSRRKEDDKSAVDLAVERDTTCALRELLVAGPRVSALDDGGVSALGIAAMGGHAKAIDALLDAGAEVNDTNDDMDTPLHLACLNLQPDSVRALLRRNADETLGNDELDTPGEIVGHYVSEDRRDEEVVEWIREMLARAPADRIWRRRGWLAMLSARRHQAAEEEQALLHPHQQQTRPEEDTGAQGGSHEAESDPATAGPAKEKACVPVAARRKLSIRSNADGSAERVHPSLKSFHWIVTNMIDVSDELIFRKIVSYL
ncbi:unnamed protein product [Scytosiphon promiscuus]